MSINYKPIHARDSEGFESRRHVFRTFYLKDDIPQITLHYGRMENLLMHLQGPTGERKKGKDIFHAFSKKKK